MDNARPDIDLIYAIVVLSILCILVLGVVPLVPVLDLAEPLQSLGLGLRRHRRARIAVAELSPPLG